MTENEARQTEAAADEGVEELAIAMRGAIRNLDAGLDDLMSAEPAAVGQKAAEAQAQANENGRRSAPALYSARHGSAGPGRRAALPHPGRLEASTSTAPRRPDPARLAKRGGDAGATSPSGIRDMGSDDLAEEPRATSRWTPPASRTALSGMRPNAPALVYLVAHTGFGAVKVGVSEVRRLRVSLTTAVKAGSWWPLSS